MPRSIQTLPTELLPEIFAFATPNSGGSVPISHVCRKFRTIALSTPALWATFKIGVSDRFAHQDESYPLIRIFLKRARTHPISITIDVRQSQSPSDKSNNENQLGGGDVEVLCEALMIGPQHLANGSAWDAIKQWRAIHLFADSWALMYIFLQRFAAICSPHSDAALPIMSDVQFVCCTVYSSRHAFNPRNLVTPIKLFGGVSLPNLKVATFDRAHVDWWAFVKSLYKETLTRGEPLGRGLESLSLCYHAGEVFPPQGVVDSLLYGSRDTLRNLCFSCSGPATAASPLFTFDRRDAILQACLPPTNKLLNPRTPLLLPVLDKLTLRFFDILYGFNLFKSLEIPACTTLHIADDTSLSYDGEDAPGAQTTMAEMLILTFFKDHESLETGALKNVTLTGMSYISLPIGRSIWTAKAFQSVENLNLRVVSLEALDLEMTIERFGVGTPTTLPNLKNLTLRNCEGSGIPGIRHSPVNRDDSRPENFPTILRLLPILKRRTGLKRISYYHKDFADLPSGVIDSLAKDVEVTSFTESDEGEEHF